MPLKGKTILIVEDEELLREVIAEEFQYAGLKVIEACGGNEALKLLEVSNDIDILFTDIKMPDGNGIDLVKQVHLLPIANRPKVFMFTAYGEFPESEMDTYEVLHKFKKPFVWEEIIQIIKDKGNF
jgi:CheY-like chemotaxis protein